MWYQHFLITLLDVLFLSQLRERDSGSRERKGGMVPDLYFREGQGTHDGMGLYPKLVVIYGYIFCWVLT